MPSTWYGWTEVLALVESSFPGSMWHFDLKLALMLSLAAVFTCTRVAREQTLVQPSPTGRAFARACGYRAGREFGRTTCASCRLLEKTKQACVQVRQPPGQGIEI